MIFETNFDSSFPNLELYMYSHSELKKEKVFEIRSKPL